MSASLQKDGTTQGLEEQLSALQQRLLEAKKSYKAVLRDNTEPPMQKIRASLDEITNQRLLRIDSDLLYDYASMASTRSSTPETKMLKKSINDLREETDIFVAVLDGEIAKMKRLLRGDTAEKGIIGLAKDIGRSFYDATRPKSIWQALNAAGFAIGSMSGIIEVALGHNAAALPRAIDWLKDELPYITVGGFSINGATSGLVIQRYIKFYKSEKRERQREEALASTAPKA